MNCQEFSLSLDALIDAHPMAAETRGAVVRHADECARCTARWRDGQAVQAALRATAYAESGRAPERVKTALLTAFAQHHAATSSVVSLAQRRKMRAWQWCLAAAAALAVCLLLGLAARRWQAAGAPAVARQQSSGATPARPTDNAPVATAAIPDQPKNATSVKKAARQPVAAGKAAAFVAVKSDPAPRRALVAPRATGKVRATDTDTAPTELVTEYIPLTYVPAATAMESGQVVRITLPRSSAVALGLPAHVGNTGDTVKADVVLGDDGLARQIRFVYQPESNTGDGRKLQ